MRFPPATPKRSAARKLDPKNAKSQTRRQRGLCTLERNSSADRPEDQGEEQEHEGDVEPAEHGRIRVGERGEEGAAEGHEPDLVAVPERTDRVHHQATVFIGPGERVEDADAEVEAVEHGVPDQQDAEQPEPDQ
jgi:hypothetical protein